MFDQTEKRYLNVEELGFISQYVDSLPTRLDTYRTIRDQELEIMQTIADQLQANLSQVAIATLEQSLKNGLLVLRYCAMAVLLNDPAFVQNRLIVWLSNLMSTHDTCTVDAELHRLLNQKLAQTLNPNQLSLLTPMLSMVQQTLKPAPAMV